MDVAFRRNHWVLAGGHANQDFLGSSLPVLMWTFEKFIPKSLGWSLREKFWQVAIAASQGRMLPQLKCLNWKGEGLEKGQKVGKRQWSVMVTCIPCLHLVFSALWARISLLHSPNWIPHHPLYPSLLIMKWKHSHCTSWFLQGENKLENVLTGAHSVHTFRKFIPGDETSQKPQES